ncbi:hypothetical protein BCR44DRAFT_1440661 [Catenaria anguillulae PL171]|uniref:Uncharacterized protein n=1 Tax=Catenaria anguillulae PL171 TaxID=765915 RepID=A0A1Y2HC93_9FUNG|nr:hypothetical protein BCR44DRAFT_1440661 [Catenaria anguillulae PL171]
MMGPCIRSSRHVGLGACHRPSPTVLAWKILICLALLTSALSASSLLDPYTPQTTQSIGGHVAYSASMTDVKARHESAIGCYHLNRCSGHGYCDPGRNMCICDAPPTGQEIYVSPPSVDCSRWGDDAFSDFSRTLMRAIVPPPFLALTLYSIYQLVFKSFKRNPLHARVFDLAWLLVSFICVFRAVHFLIFPLSSIHPTSQISGQVVFAVFFSLFLSLLSLVLLCWIRVQTLAHYACFPPPAPISITVTQDQSSVPSSSQTVHTQADSRSSSPARDHNRVYRVYSALSLCFIVANVVMYLVIILLFSLNLATSLFGILFMFMFFLVILAVVSICGYLILHREYSKLLHTQMSRAGSTSSPWPKSPAVPNVASEDMLHLVMRPEIMSMRDKSTRLAAYVFIAAFSSIIGRSLLQQADAPSGVSDPNTWLWLQLIGRVFDFFTLFTIVAFLSKVPYYSETVLPLSLRNPTAAAAAQRAHQGFQHPIHLPPATLVIKSVDPSGSGSSTPSSRKWATSSRTRGESSGMGGADTVGEDVASTFERNYWLVHGKSIEAGSSAAQSWPNDSGDAERDSPADPSQRLPDVPSAPASILGGGAGSCNELAPSPGALDRQRADLLARVLELQRSTRVFEEQRAAPHGARPTSVVICGDGLSTTERILHPLAPSRVRTPVPIPVEEVDVWSAGGDRERGPIGW